ncbi:conserved hypothetical protein [Paecilomyces variotii No. 5]|uniref:Uncharacterized protein n=1 Tax=Byssochlamys spectabilis (strain No. 5 / NBRC 109023) TaxID=1356009 RepID=V5G6X4_BYSSN|nr:conserved hypothetical protein [Paecilomyces variotii No. 5]
MKLVQTTKQFHLRWSQKTVVPPVAARYLGAQSHPIRPKIAHMYANRDPDTLWWRVQTNSLDHKRVVRSWCARRVRNAFRKALRDRGYDGEGRRISQSTDAVEPSSQPEPGLKGSVEIVVRPESIKEKFTEVLKESSSLVDTVVQLYNQRNSKPQRKPGGGKHQAGRSNISTKKD